MDTLFFIISELIGLCLQVETWLAVALATAAVASLLGCKRLSASLSAATFLTITLISIFPIDEVLLAPLEAEYATRDMLEQVDGIVVLGGAESPRKTLRWSQPQLNDASERLTPPNSPQTNGMVERFNGRIVEVLQSHHFLSGEELEASLHRYIWLYNQKLPQSALGSRAPLQAMKDWHKLKPELFGKQPYSLSGCNT